jgi:glycine dehydrogenase subunit 1
MTFFPHTPEERREMLATIGVPDLEALFDDIPSELRFPALSLPRALSELELKTEIEELARRNTTQDTVHSFLGGGSYRHFIPATVDYVLQRGEFYTSYTPYQPELSQGMLQAMFEYQTAICRLTGMEVSNASHYDGATSLAEAVLLCLDSVRDKRRRVVMAPSVHPHYRAVAETYLLGTDVEVLTPADPYLSASKLMDYVDEETTALVIQTPSFLGFVEDLRNIADRLHDMGARLIVATDPISLGLFRPPGELGADVVVADGQPLGIAPSFGGPSVGIFATRKAFIRRLAGRLVGQTVDADGNRGYVLTLATREQHIRRAKATSNICTNAALGALAAIAYLATLGNAGLRRVAELSFHKAHYAAEGLGSIPGITVNDARPGAPFFKEFVLSLPASAERIHNALREHHGIDCGLPLARFYPEHDNKLLVAVTEMNTRAGIDQFSAALREVASE